MNGGLEPKVDHYLVQIRNVGQFIGIGRGNMQTKICIKCNIEFPLDNFHKGGGAFKRDNQCKRCRLETNKERRLKPNIKIEEKIIPKKYAIYHSSINKHIVRSKLPAEYHDLTDEQFNSLLKIQGGKCNICGMEFKNDYTVDCIVPISKGGALTFYNTQLLCKKCNSIKKDKIIKCNLYLEEKFKIKGYFTQFDYQLLDLIMWELNYL